MSADLRPSLGLGRLAGLRAFVATAVIVGLFAMHGLGMGVLGAEQQLGPSMTMTSASMAIQVMPTMTPQASAGQSAMPAEGCGMDHTNCQAVLRSQLDPPSYSAIHVTPSPVAATVTGVFSAPASPRAPPDVCLIRLCISRT